MKDPDPDHIKAIDCSELVEWLFSQIGITVPDGSYNQAKMCRAVTKETLVIGDLGFKWDPATHAIHHVGIFIGDNKILEAKGKQWGTLITPLDKFTASSHFAWWGRLKNVEDA